MNISRSRRKFRAFKTGAVTVEVAVCLPVLIVVLFACYEFAHVNMVIHATESAAYEATRAAIVPGATDAKVNSAAQSVLNSVGVRDFTLRITPDPISQTSDTVRVEITVPFGRNTNVFRMFINNPTFRGICELNREKL